MVKVTFREITLNWLREINLPAICSKKKTRNVQIMVLNVSSVTEIVRIFMLAWPRLLESWLALTNG